MRTAATATVEFAADKLGRILTAPDSLHLASLFRVQALDPVFVSSDKRFAEVVGELGFEVINPEAE